MEITKNYGKVECNFSAVRAVNTLNQMFLYLLLFCSYLHADQDAVLTSKTVQSHKITL